MSAKNIRHNTAAGGSPAAPLTRHPVSTAQLLWGDDRQLRAALAASAGAAAAAPPPPQQQEPAAAAAGGAAAAGQAPAPPCAFDAILLSDVVYGSDPGLWEKLVATLAAASDGDTLIAQAETRRVEGRLYHQVGGAPPRFVHMLALSHLKHLRPTTLRATRQTPMQQYWELLEASGFERREVGAAEREKLQSDLPTWPAGGAECSLCVLAKR